MRKHWWATWLPGSRHQLNSSLQMPVGQIATGRSGLLVCYGFWYVHSALKYRTAEPARVLRASIRVTWRATLRRGRIRRW